MSAHRLIQADLICKLLGDCGGDFKTVHIVCLVHFGEFSLLDYLEEGHLDFSWSFLFFLDFD